MAAGEHEVLQSLDTMLRRAPVRAALDPIVRRVESRLLEDPEAVMAYEPVPLSVYGEKLPDSIGSSWIFILRAGVATGAERHPNSRQRMMSYRGSGDLQTRPGAGWQSHHLVSDPAAPLAKRWVSIPPSTWHQVVLTGRKAPEENWVVVSYHTVPDAELIEERPDPANPDLTRRRRYVEKRP